MRHGAEIINRSLHVLGVIGAGETAASDDSSDALAVLNQMLQSLVPSRGCRRIAAHWRRSTSLPTRHPIRLARLARRLSPPARSRYSMGMCG